MRGMLATVLLLLFSGAAYGQDRFAFELRGGAAFPQDLGDAQLDPGAGVEVTGRFRVLEHLSLYAGWDWYRFSNDEGAGIGGFDVEDTGYAFGVHFGHPLMGSVGGWLRGGGVYDHIEIEDETGESVGDTDHQLGWEVGAGATIPLTGSLALTPGVRYRTFAVDELAGLGADLDMTYVAAEIGLAWSLGGDSRHAVRGN